MTHKHIFSDWSKGSTPRALQFRTCSECLHQQTRRPLGEGKFMNDAGRIVAADGKLWKF